MNWFPEWSSILLVAVLLTVVQASLRVRRVRREFSEHRVARFFGWPIDAGDSPTQIYWIEGVTRAEVENALLGYTDRYWGWLCRPAVRRTLVFANPLSWLLTIYGSTDLPLSLGLSESVLSWWAFTPIPLWLAVRRSVRLVADAPDEMLDERLRALRDRTYVGSYRTLSFGLSLFAAPIIILNDFMSDLDDGAVDAQIQMLTAGAYAAIWAVPALPSVLLAWTLRCERHENVT